MSWPVVFAGDRQRLPWLLVAMAVVLAVVMGVVVGNSRLLLQNISLPGVTVLAPTANQRVTFLALGDTGSGTAAQYAVAMAMEQVAATEPVHFALMLGDNFYFNGVDSTTDPLWKTRFEQVYRGPHLDGLRFYALPGNHDARGSIAAQEDYASQDLGSGRWTMPGRTWVQDFGSSAGRPVLRLLALDLTPYFAGPETERPAVVAGLVAQIQQAFSGPDLPPWRLVASHFPLRTAGAKHGAKYRAAIAAAAGPLVQAMQEHCVGVYLSGHAHNLQLLQPAAEPLFLVSGAGGKRLYPVDPSQPDVQFLASRFGFSKLSLSADSLTVGFHADNASSVFSRTYPLPACAQPRDVALTD